MISMCRTTRGYLFENRSMIGGMSAGATDSAQPNRISPTSVAIRTQQRRERPLTRHRLNGGLDADHGTVDRASERGWPMTSA
jgi:hypothetical protein